MPAAFVEDDDDRPRLGDRSCACGGAGMPCPICDQTDDGEFPALPEGFVPEVVKKPTLRASERSQNGGAPPRQSAQTIQAVT
jgi:hypothetical protein